MFWRGCLLYPLWLFYLEYYLQRVKPYISWISAQSPLRVSISKRALSTFCREEHVDTNRGTQCSSILNISRSFRTISNKLCNTFLSKKYFLKHVRRICNKTTSHLMDNGQRWLSGERWTLYENHNPGSGEPGHDNSQEFRMAGNLKMDVSDVSFSAWVHQKFHLAKLSYFDLLISSLFPVNLDINILPHPWLGGCNFVVPGAQDSIGHEDYRILGKGFAQMYVPIPCEQNSCIQWRGSKTPAI